MALQITRLVEPSFQLGECPTWDEKTGRLLWADIRGCTVHSMDWQSREITSYRFDNEVGSFGLTDDGRLIVAVWDRVVLFDPATGASEELAAIETDMPQTRLNDGKVGPDGAFWVGTMDTSSPRAPIASLYRVAADGAVTKIRDGLQVSNGLAWSPDGSRMYHSDSSPGWIEAYGFDAASGAVGTKTQFAQQTNETGRPDGATVDVSGNYWSAGVSAGVLNCFAPDGTLSRAIPVPVPRPTMPCFCGPDLDQLVLTSLKAGDLPADTVSGALYLVEGHGTSGLPTSRFRTVG